MTNKLHIDITKTDEVKGISSGTGMVTKTNWNPGTGRRVSEEETRQKQAAFEAMVEAQRLAANPELQRIETLESEVKELKSKLISFIELYGQK